MGKKYKKTFLGGFTTKNGSLYIARILSCPETCVIQRLGCTYLAKFIAYLKDNNIRTNVAPVKIKKLPLKIGDFYLGANILILFTEAVVYIVCGSFFTSSTKPNFPWIYKQLIFSFDQRPENKGDICLAYMWL